MLIKALSVYYTSVRPIKVLTQPQGFTDNKGFPVVFSWNHFILRLYRSSAKVVWSFSCESKPRRPSAIVIRQPEGS